MAYPNPTDDYVEFTWDNLPPFPSIQLFNITGEMIWQGKISKEFNTRGSLHLNTEMLPAGVYFYQLFSNEKITRTQPGKLIIQRL
jgi:hypothetical protein